MTVFIAFTHEKGLGRKRMMVMMMMMMITTLTDTREKKLGR
jgi:hypothetical protein